MLRVRKPVRKTHDVSKVDTSHDMGHVNMQRMALSMLTPADYNPRTMKAKNKEGLSKSLDTYGLVQPIIYNSRTGHVVGGHQRLSLLISKGVKDTDVVVIDVTPAQEKELNITLNNSNITGDFDTNLLQDMLSDIDDSVKEELMMDTLEIHAVNEEFTFDDDDNINDGGGVTKNKLYTCEITFTSQEQCNNFIVGIGCDDKMKGNNIVINGDTLDG